jgi:hypothetical protein
MGYLQVVLMRQRGNKYHNKKVVHDGIKFASKSEGERYLELKAMQEKGEIRDLVIQPKFILQESFRKNGELFRAIHYVADFQYNQHGPSGLKLVIEDVKGYMGYTTPEFKIKRKLFEARYPDLSLTITQMNNRKKTPVRKLKGKDT